MKRKEIVDRVRLRHVSEGFGWVDHRLVRDGHVRGRSGGALALYLFLVTVADGDGVSYYSDETLCGHLGFNLHDLGKFRRELVESVLVAWSRPFYQVLALPSAGENRPGLKEAPLIPHDGGGRLVPGNDGVVGIGEVLGRMMGGCKNDRL
jgi:hypothetical protein